MIKTQGHILKGNNVKLEGSLQLGALQRGNRSSKQAPGDRASVNIIEKNQQFAIIEINCSCGEKIHVKCEYDNSQPLDQQKEQPEKTQQTNGENNNESTK